MRIGRVVVIGKAKNIKPSKEGLIVEDAEKLRGISKLRKETLGTG